MTTIHYEPATVRVSDDRQTVPGARITVGAETYDIIPREGDSVECWLGRLAERVTSPACARALAAVASAGAAGESGEADIELGDGQTVEITAYVHSGDLYDYQTGAYLRAATASEAAASAAERSGTGAFSAFVTPALAKRAAFVSAELAELAKRAEVRS